MDSPIEYEVIDIIENTILDLSSNENLRDLLIEMKNSDSSLPYYFNNNSLILKDYYIGNIQVAQYIININPRIEYLSIDNYMEMYLYIQGISLDFAKSLHSQNTFGRFQSNLTSQYLTLLNSITRSGLEGEFSEVLNNSSKINGRIDLNYFNYVDYKKNLLPFFRPYHSPQTKGNALLKKALEKISNDIFDHKEVTRNNMSSVKSYFETVDYTVYEDYDLINTDYSLLNYINKDYYAALELAKKILSEFKTTYKDREKLGSSFLINSNNIFEEYTRTILQNHLNNKVIKWNEPQTFAKIYNNITKSYSPDILIDFDKKNMICLAVLDAKHKHVQGLEKIADVTDLYQLIFYCNQLKSRKGGLIYPLNGRREPALVNTLNNTNLKIYCYFLDFSISINQRHLLFINDIKKSLLLY